jgi:hypothetical protein
MKAITKVAVAVIVATLLVGFACASYVMTSNTVTVTVMDPIAMTLTTSTSSTVSGQSITLTAYIEDQVNAPSRLQQLGFVWLGCFFWRRLCKADDSAKHDYAQLLR